VPPVPSLPTPSSAPTDALYLIDAIGPFFRGYQKRTINWSKLPFENVRLSGPESDAQWTQIYADMEVLCEKAAAMGFNAITLDDVTHLTDHPWLEVEIRAKVQRWQELLRPCFAIAAKHGMQVFLTMDVFSTTPGVREMLTKTRRTVDGFVAEVVDVFLTTFPEVAGVIMRIGEADGKDIQDDFRSELHLMQPKQVNRFLKQLLPVFEKHGRTLIFRTWSVGAYRVGDLMWRRETFAKVLKDVEHNPALVVSMKYGESDFFRYLPLNRHFFESPVAKIVEFQTRREYEGCGEYPSFIGWEYERYARELQHASNLRGCSVWSQTGGWVPFRRLAFLDKEAVWTDLNTFVTIKVFKARQLVEDAVRDFASQQGIAESQSLVELLRLSDEVIRELLYVEEFARHPLYFRRVRIPPMVSVYWHNLFISHSVKKILCHFVEDKDASLLAAEVSMGKIGQMKTLAAECGLPVEDIEFMEDTFGLLLLARRYYLLPFTPEVETELRAAKKAYKQKYPKGGGRYRYRVKMDFKPFLLRYRQLGWAVSVLMRRQQGYRLVDSIFTLYGLSMLYRVVARRRPQWIPKFAQKMAMGVETIFK